MTDGKSGVGSHKHGTSGKAPHSPRFKHKMKREAEADEKKDRSRIKDPVQSVKELFK